MLEYVHTYRKYDKQDQQGKAAFNDPATRTSGKSPGGPQTKTAQGGQVNH
jgi:hypothetical protein